MKCSHDSSAAYLIQIKASAGRRKAGSCFQQQIKEAER
jgi:hypothetical protein